MSRKRPNDFNNLMSIKKQNIVNWNEMISASSVRNYLLNDPLLDWLKYYSINNINDIPIQRNYISNNNFIQIYLINYLSIIL